MDKICADSSEFKVVQTKTRRKVVVIIGERPFAEMTYSILT